MVIASYRPKPGQAEALLGLVREHVPILREQQLATAREPLVLRAKDGTLLEIFEWVSPAAVEAAHGNQAVLALWERFGAACEFVSLASLPEAQAVFAHFEPVEL